MHSEFVHSASYQKYLHCRTLLEVRIYPPKLLDTRLPVACLKLHDLLVMLWIIINCAEPKKYALGLQCKIFFFFLWECEQSHRFPRTTGSFLKILGVPYPGSAPDQSHPDIRRFLLLLTSFGLHENGNLNLSHKQNIQVKGKGGMFAVGKHRKLGQRLKFGFLKSNAVSQA